MTRINTINTLERIYSLTHSLKESEGAPALELVRVRVSPPPHPSREDLKLLASAATLTEQQPLLPPEQIPYLNHKMKQKGYNVDVDLLIVKLERFRNELFHNSEVGITDGSFQSLNNLINSNPDLKRLMLIDEDINSSTWNAFKEVVGELASYEENNSLRYYSDQPEIKLFKTQKKLISKMLEQKSEQVKLPEQNVEAFLNFLFNFIAKNADRLLLVSLDEFNEGNLNELHIYLNKDSTKKGINRQLPENIDNLTDVLVAALEGKLKSSYGDETKSTALDFIKNEKARTALLTIIDERNDINSFGDLLKAINDINFVDLNRIFRNFGVNLNMIESDSQLKDILDASEKAPITSS